MKVKEEEVRKGGTNSEVRIGEVKECRGSSFRGEMMGGKL